MYFIGDKEDVAGFVRDLLHLSEINFQSITVTRLMKSGDYSVLIVTDGLSAGIVETLAQTYYEAPMNTLHQNIPAG